MAEHLHHPRDRIACAGQTGGGWSSSDRGADAYTGAARQTAGEATPIAADGRRGIHSQCGGTRKSPTGRLDVNSRPAR
ncbi:hypothetical protein DAEQUDRAFT_252867 [Daedalea quercina L-15889]|uniref:Uncharacterized protein n=1 Tax=Daedalea quercina L-15889 TaxID=1314783 RepID=A0A165QHJ9_9APHY|nr:hypothetical protein DAEQUDRAFT_252867 [Daedalea quercina L-15889]